MGTVVYAIGRIAVVITFIVSGVLRLMDIGGTGAMLASKMGPLPGSLAVGTASIEAVLRVPFPQVLVVVGASIEIVAGLLIATGIFTRWAALALFVFTAVNIYYFHDFWNLGGAELMTGFNKLSIMGALLILAVVGDSHVPGVGEGVARAGTP